MSDSTTIPVKITGSCACGKVQFTAKSPPSDTCYCYCTKCRKCSGAPYIPFLNFRKDQVEWKNQPDEWASSSFAQRTYCATCSSCIAMLYDSSPDNIWITLGCIDEGLELIPDKVHCIFVSEKPKWAELPAGVPCFDKFPTSEQSS
jgi:hypothetical protein